MNQRYTFMVFALILIATNLVAQPAAQNNALPREVSENWWQTVQKNLRESEYHISKRSDGNYGSPNRAQNLRFTYESNGFSATRRDSLSHLWQARLTYNGVSKNGDGPKAQDQSGFAMNADANTLTTQNETVMIKYRNSEKGMRQDFIVKSKPNGTGDLRLWLNAEMQGGTVKAMAEQLSFLTASGAEAMRYTDLKVWDGSQKRLKARFEKIGNEIAIVVSDARAIYPITIDPLSTTPNWTAESDQGSAQFGLSVASAGDVNGDGFSDVIVGSPLYDNSETNEGQAFVYHGSSTGLSLTPNWTARGNQASAEFGHSVASAGDVNGDGYSDVVIGARYFDNTENDEGAAFVFHGSAAGLSTTPNWTAESNQNFAEFGWSVASAGDVNGDGFSDVVIGAYVFDNGETNEGGAFLWYGSSTGVNSGVNGNPTNAAWTAESNQAFGQLGFSVASAGDVNGDGFSDIIIGARFYDNPTGEEGAAFVWHGSITGVNAGVNGIPSNAAWLAESDQGSAQFGYTVASAGDVNGDGFSDVIVGAPFFDNGETNEGRAFVWYGSGSGVNADVDGNPTNATWSAESDQAQAQFGISVAAAGDVNGDGFCDVIVGAQLYDNPEVNEGRAYTFFGSSSGLSSTPNWTAESNQDNAIFGWPVASAGDVNGDGFSDLIVGSRNFSNGESAEGQAFVYYGGAGTLSATAIWTAESNQANAELGWSVACAGDVNGDGFSDVIVGSPYFDNGESDEGLVYVYHGSATGLSATPNWTAESNQANTGFGWWVSTAGDVNGDGFSDVIIGAQVFDNGETDEGRALVYHGSASGLSFVANWTAEGNQAGAWFGNYVATAGDVNGDGFSDVIVGARFYDNGETDEGRAFVYYGSAIGLSTAPNWMDEGNQNNANYSWSIASAGDVNGDGFSDIIVGAIGYSNGESAEGQAFVYHGSKTGLSATPNWTAESNQAGANFGNSVSAGDVNGDGFSDVIIGAWYFDNGQIDEGRAYVYHGSASGLSTTPNWTAEGNQTGANFGNMVTSAGDINGDGFSDVIVMSWFFDNGEIDEGRGFAFFGSASGLSSSPDWTVESNQTESRFGVSLSSAGDVNGDGFSDIIIGAMYFDNGETNEGRAFVYYGNEVGGYRQDIRQFRPFSSTPIVPALKTTTASDVQLRKREKSIIGRSQTKIQLEVKPLGTPFNGLGLQESTFNLHSTTGTLTDLIVGGLNNRTLYKWRVRQVESPEGIGYLLLPRSRWYYLAGVAPTESKFQVSDDDAPLPVELLYFRAFETSAGINLEWQTATEVDNAGFIIKRDGVELASFRTNDALLGQGTTLTATDYAFTDNMVKERQTYTYTLYDVNYNGVMTQHEPVTLTYKGALSYNLAQNYPNPFNPTTTIRYELPAAGSVKLAIFDILGREVATLVNSKQASGSYVFTLNSSAYNLSSGVYFYRLESGGFSQTRKMLLLK